MYICKQFVYLGLHKTGSTYIQKYLQTVPQLQGKVRSGHPGVQSFPFWAQPKRVVGSIRNPWDWYVSLWAFGCLQKGGLYRKLTGKASGHPLSQQWKDHFQELYSDKSNEEHFRQWLQTILADHKEEILGINGKYGLMTARYLNMYNDRWKKKGKHLADLTEVVAFDKEHNRLTAIIRQERLDEDLTNFLSSVLTDFTTEDISARSKRNLSIRQEYQQYYDESMIQLVEENEAFIIKKYGYEY